MSHNTYIINHWVFTYTGEGNITKNSKKSKCLYRFIVV